MNIKEILPIIQQHVELVLEECEYLYNTAQTREMLVNKIYECLHKYDNLIEYDIICDETNNSPDIINSNDLIIDTCGKDKTTGKHFYFRSSFNKIYYEN